MQNKIKDHIDALFKVRLKEAIDTELNRIKNNSALLIDKKEEKQLKNKIKKKIKEHLSKQYKYSSIFSKMLSQDFDGSYFPSNQDEDDLFKLLNLEVLYKRTLKSACDDDHPIVQKLLEDLQIDKALIGNYIDRIKRYNSEPIEFYSLFQEELINTNYRIDSICETIDKLSEDSRHGSIVSHPAKMTNPECKFPKIFSTSSAQPDGFVRSGNTESRFDMHINAVNLKVFKFLSLQFRKRPLLDYIRENNSLVFKQVFGVSESRAKTWINNFARCTNNQDTKTNKYIRQVYFPVKDNYHLLSLLTSSGTVFNLKEKIDQTNDRSPAAFSGKKFRKNNEYSKIKYSTILNLTVTRHGGEHPKNISGLNNKYQSYYLLQSTPPSIKKRNIHFPKHNFFKESFRYYEYREVFDALHNLFKTDYNNKRIREGRDYRLQDLMDLIIDKMWAVRSVCKEQYRPKESRLKSHQQIWLCDDFQISRELEDSWLDKLCEEISRWVIQTYEKLLGKQAYKLGESERLHAHAIVSNNKEALR